MVTEIAPVTFQYSHTIGRSESRGGRGFFNPVAIARGEGNLMYVLSRGTETPAFTPCKRVTVFTVDEELVGEFGQKVGPEDADASAPDGSFMWLLRRISIWSWERASWSTKGVLGQKDVIHPHVRLEEVQ